MMDLNKQQTEALRVHDLYWESYINGDVETLASLLDENYTQVGSVENEVFHNKKDAVQFIDLTIDQIRRKVDMRNRVTRTEMLDNLVLVSERFDLYALINNTWIFYAKFRASTFLHFRNGKWLIIHQHSSMPDTRAEEGENIALNKIATENQQLKEAVRRRTIELEHQNRELEIETALERVRTVAMSMKEPADMITVCRMISDQVHLLGFENVRNVQTVIFDEARHEYLNYQYFAPYHQEVIELMDYTVHPALLEFANNMLSSEDAFGVTIFENEALVEWRQHRSETNQLPDPLLDKAQAVCYYFYSIGSGALGISSYARLKDEHIGLLKRFRNVFQLAYRRFIDIQQAESQTREAQIQLALERVRSKAMAMHGSEDLAATISIFFHEIEALSITPRRCGVGLLDKETHTAELSTMNTTEQGKFVEVIGSVQMLGHPVLEGIYEHWIKQEEYHPVLKGNEIKDYYQTLKPQISLPDYPLDIVQYGYFFFFPEGGVYAWTHQELSEDELKFYRRFTSVLSLTYKRYQDLKYAELQAHKARIETALEKVRARALAMQSPEELVEVSEVLRYEMGLLGVEELETCSIYLHNETSGETECWYAIKDLSSEKNQLISDHVVLNLVETWVGREMIKFYASPDKHTSIVMKGEARKEWIHYCEDQSSVLKGYFGEMIPERTYHLYKFSYGAIGAASAGDISPESWDLLQRAASVFSLAYSRFRDLTQARHDLRNLKEEKQRAETALKELKATQTQLIQAEKMASLGELTAGIAHEIQNPLNFVNNFSEVNVELTNEIIESINSGNLDEAKELAADIRSNQEKIREHGKRADGIVKSMLQHSRTGTGQKELNDLAKLADEYLRLSFHGMRAKDKSFNSDFELITDPDLPLVNIIPQDIGRVILNLINNAFYAVNEKKKISGDDYKPKVTVSLRKNPESSIQNPEFVQISISDNGTGIPDKVKEKIFQPFFTTKPTGEGTGLGLSLSYDIITKAHGGTISVETSGQMGTRFTIQLPIDT